MNFIKRLKDCPYLFPVSYVVIHIITYCIYFISINFQLPLSDWFIYGGPPSLRLVWFSDIHWPNFSGIFLIISFFCFKKLRKLSVFYLFALYIEQLIFKFDIGECFSGVILVRLFYLFFKTILHFSDGRDFVVIHFSLLLALVHISVIFYLKNDKLKHVI